MIGDRKNLGNSSPVANHGACPASEGLRLLQLVVSQLIILVFFSLSTD